MNKLPNHIYSGAYKEGHVQGIAVDTERGYVYYSFTTMLLKTDLLGNPVGSVIRLAGHLGCITYDQEKKLVYGSLELKHDSIGAGIINRIGYDATAEDAFYLVAFDCEKINTMNMNAETDGVMSSVYLSDVVEDYTGTDEASGRPHRYGCSGIDGTGLGPAFGRDKSSEKKIMVAYGVYSDLERNDNDYQVILEYGRDIFEKYGKPLNQSKPHHSGPESADNRYFFHTGNTSFGIQNLEYDPYTESWLVAVYTGKKPEFDNFRMFFIDGTVLPKEAELSGRGGERGLLLTPARLGTQGKQADISGCMFPYGQTGVASFGDGSFYFSHNGGNKEDKTFFTDIYKYQIDSKNDNMFSIEKENC